MKIEQSDFCPLLKKKCKGLECSWFTKVEGYNINTGKQVDEWRCAVSFIPMLLIENAGMSRQTGAAVESFRNEMVKSNEDTRKAFVAAIEHNLSNSKLIKMEEK